VGLNHPCWQIFQPRIAKNQYDTLSQCNINLHIGIDFYGRTLMKVLIAHQLLNPCILTRYPKLYTPHLQMTTGIYAGLHSITNKRNREAISYKSRLGLQYITLSQSSDPCFHCLKSRRSFTYLDIIALGSLETLRDKDSSPCCWDPAIWKSPEREDLENSLTNLKPRFESNWFKIDLNISDKLTGLGVMLNC